MGLGRHPCSGQSTCPSSGAAAAHHVIVHCSHCAACDVVKEKAAADVAASAAAASVRRSIRGGREGGRGEEGKGKWWRGG